MPNSKNIGDSVQKWIIEVKICYRQTDRQTNTLTPYTGGVDFFFKLNLLPSYSHRLQGDYQNMSTNNALSIENVLFGHCCFNVQISALGTRPIEYGQMKESEKRNERESENNS